MSMRNLRGVNLKNQQSSLPGLLGTATVRGGIGPGGLVAAQMLLVERGFRRRARVRNAAQRSGGAE